MTNLFSQFARRASTWFAHPFAFALAILFVAGWATCGPVFKYSDTWQLVINTSTTILTFLMVFLVQNAQNRDSRAMQLKLDELLRAVSDARDDMIDLENLSEDQIEVYRKEFEKMQHRYQSILEAQSKVPPKPPKEEKPI